jgi:hypothetical protein
MQMPNASQQGIATLMQKPQGQAPGQQPPMPTPGKASPMAGLGSVDDRVSAYQGNTKPLEQRYAMTQDLLDLLALQKIKSQKDAAARQMQLQAAQQSAEGGQANMTVAEQRAQEVDQLTKNELAQQRGDTAQKQTGDQQAMMQKMMGGVASAPGAAMAAQPKMFASGGIIGYAGPEGSVVGGDTMGTASPEQQELASQASEMAINERNMASSERQKAKLVAELEQKLAFLTNAGSPKAAGVRAQLEAVKASGATPLPKAPPAPARPASVSEAQATAAAGPQAAVPPAAKLPPANVVAAAQGAPKPPAPSGIAGLPGAAGPAGPGAAPPAGAAPAVPDFADRTKKAAIASAELDNMAQGREEEARVEKRMALTPEQRGVYEQGIGGLQKFYNEQYDPERQRREGITRALIGAGGRRYGEFAGAATAGMAYDDQQRAAKLKEFGDVQKARTGLIDIDRANVKSGIDAGAAVAKEGAATKRQGLASSGSIYNTDVSSEDKARDRATTVSEGALNRKIEEAKVKAQQAATAAQQLASGDAKLMSYLNTIDINRDRVIQAIQKQFEPQKAMLSMQPQTDPKVKQKMDDLNTMIENEIATRTRPFEESRAQVEAKLYGSKGGTGGSGGYSVVKRPSK